MPLLRRALARHESQLAYGSPVSATGDIPNAICGSFQQARLPELGHHVEDILKISVAPDTQTTQKAASTTRIKPLQITGTPGRRHSYWLLTAAVDIDEVMTANRKLAGALGGDLSSGLSRVSMLRPAGTYNYKHQPSQPVRILDLAGSRVYDLRQLVGRLSDPKPPKPPYVPAPGPVAGIRLENPSIEVAHAALKNLDAREWMPRLTGVELSASGYMPCPFHELSVGKATAGGALPARSLADTPSNDRVSPDPLLLVPPPVYFERLTGLRVGRSGKLRCMFHDDQHPSLHVYAEPERGWYCFGCRRGGSIYDLAALLSDRSTRGPGFRELRLELELLFL